VPEELDEALHLERLKREINGLDARGIQLKILQRLDLVVGQIGDHDVALFGSEDLGIGGVVTEAHENTEWRKEATTILKVVRFLFPPTAIAGISAFAWKLWEFLAA